MKRKAVNRRKLLNTLGILLMIVAVALLALTLLMQVQEFSERYDEVLQWLADFEDAVASIPNKGLVIVAVLLIYLAKSIVPLPTSAVCVIAGMVFQTPFAVAINVAGFLILITIKFYWGKHLGGGFVHRFLYGYDNIRQVLDSDIKAKDAMLVGFRLVPVCPINTVSQLYGATGYDYYKFVLFSLLGFLPRIISYSLVGRHVYNPFSLAFMLPLVIIFTISGLAIIGVNAMIDFYNNKIKTKSTEEKKKSEG